MQFGKWMKEKLKKYTASTVRDYSSTDNYDKLSIVLVSLVTIMFYNEMQEV
jgi:hypothetical protein